MTTRSLTLPARLLIGLAGIILVLASGALAAPATAQTAAKSTTITAKSNSFETKVVKRINKLRAARGMKRVKMASCPDSYAEGGARSNARRDLLVHQDLGPIITTCHARWAGEVIAAGDSLGARAAVRMWMHSPGHKAIIMKRSIRKIGVGAFARTNGVVYLSAIAGR